MASVFPKNISLFVVTCLPLMGLACSSNKGVEDTGPSTPEFNPSGTGGSSAGGGGNGVTDSAEWPPTGFTNVTNVEFGAYALGPQVGNDVATTGSATIQNSGSQCSGIYGLVRDFQASNVPGGHPDFEYVNGDDKNITTTTLGTDGKPVYGNHPNGTSGTHSAADFNQWYNDVPSINVTYVLGLSLADRNGVRSFQSDNFYPLDNTGYGNTAGQRHNFHFTTEIHTSFTYNGGETFTFIGDDDVFVFIGGQRVIDLGGVHNAETANVRLDTLGLVPGTQYAIEIFQAERHTVESHFRFDTTLAFDDCGQVPEGVVIN